METRELKEVYRIPTAWRDLGLPGQPGKTCRSPFPSEHKNGDANPSFSVYDDGRKAKDFATGEHFDVLAFVMKARGCNVAEAIRWVKEQLGIGLEPKESNMAKRQLRLPPLREGTLNQLRELSTRRGFAMEALELAHRRGFLWFTALWGYPAWCVSDGRREQFEFRRLDGQNWPAYGQLKERKSHAYGSKRWPLGVLECLPFPKVAMVEGAPDLLAAFHFILIEGKEQIVAPVAVLGASNHQLAQPSLAHLAGKHVCIFPHVDKHGHEGALAWARQLKAAGAARVTAFDLSGLVKVDGAQGKDLADVCQINADCLEREPKFAEVLP